MEPTRSGNDDNRHEPPRGDASVPGTPREPRSGDTAAHGFSTCVPFVVQSGRTILMVEASEAGWTLAELDFQPNECVFRDSRRATYTWPREAFGAMLSRIVATDVDEAALERLTEDFTAWLGARFAHVCRPGRACR